MSKEECVFFKKILVPIDGSEHSLKAARYAAEIAEKCGSQVTLLHVLDLSLEQPMEININAWMASEEQMKIKERGREIMERTKELFDEAGISVETKYYCCGHPHRAIIRMADRQGFDLIVMGSRGVGGVKRLMLGSVADAVGRQAPCPVLIVK